MNALPAWPPLTPGQARDAVQILDDLMHCCDRLGEELGLGVTEPFSDGGTTRYALRDARSYLRVARNKLLVKIHEDES